VVVGGCSDDRADEAWRVHVEIWVRGGQDGVGCANDGADGGHDDLWCWVECELDDLKSLLAMILYV